MDNDEISRLMKRAADTGTSHDYDELFRNLLGTELFFNISQGEQGEPVSTPLVKAGESLNAVLLFTSKDNPQLKRPFGGIAWERALEMVAGMPHADGLILQDNAAVWIGLDQAKVRALLAPIP